jgi:GNAT superfamily N-acetyltransferase
MREMGDHEELAVAVHPRARGQGLGRNIGAFLLAEALRRHRAAALMVEEWNHAARRTYSGLGLRYRPLAAAAVQGPGKVV